MFQDKFLENDMKLEKELIYCHQARQYQIEYNMEHKYELCDDLLELMLELLKQRKKTHEDNE